MTDYVPRLGRKVDPTRCRADVMYYEGNWPRNKQCDFKPRPGSKYCGIHNPEKVAERRAAVRARDEAKWAKELEARKFGRVGKRLMAALEQIRDGHNDPRSLAAEVLEKVS